MSRGAGWGLTRGAFPQYWAQLSSSRCHRTYLSSESSLVSFVVIRCYRGLVALDVSAAPLDVQLRENDPPPRYLSVSDVDGRGGVALTATTRFASSHLLGLGFHSSWGAAYGGFGVVVSVPTTQTMGNHTPWSYHHHHCQLQDIDRRQIRCSPAQGIP